MFGMRFGKCIAHLFAHGGEQLQRRFLAEIADQFLVFLIVEQHALFLVEQHDGDLRCIHHRFDQRLLVLHLAFEAVHFSHVAVHAEVMRGVAFFAHHRSDGDVRQIAAAVLALVYQQAVPRTLALDLRPQRFVHQLGRDAIGQHGFVMTDYFVLFIAGDALERAVGIQDIGARIGDGDRQRGLFHCLAKQVRRQRLARIRGLVRCGWVLGHGSSG